MKSHSIKSSHADLPCPCATDCNFHCQDQTFFAHCWHSVRELAESPLRTNLRQVFGCMTLHLTLTGYEPSVPDADANMDMSGTRLLPKMNLTHDDDDTNFHMFDIPLQPSASPKFTSKNSALATLSPAGCDPVRNVHSLVLVPNQTGQNSWQKQKPRKCTCSSWTKTRKIGYNDEKL